MDFLIIDNEGKRSDTKDSPRTQGCTILAGRFVAFGFGLGYRALIPIRQNVVAKASKFN
jgi:hypothetical protein